MVRLNGKAALVTGAGRGIGAETARLLAEAGARVVVTDNVEENGRRTTGEITAAGGKADFVAHDVADEASWENVLHETRVLHGGLDILVNNAGVYDYGSILEMSVERYRRIMDVNVLGVFLGMKHAVALMKGRLPGRDSASIINLSSVAGLVGSPLTSIYSASKGAVRLMTKSVAVEVAKLHYNIRVNSIHPGVVETDMAEQVLERWQSTGMSDTNAWLHVVEQHPLGRVGQPNEIARAILFLASPDSSFVTGSELVVDGGWTAR